MNKTLKDKMFICCNNFHEVAIDDDIKQAVNKYRKFLVKIKGDNNIFTDEFDEIFGEFNDE